jgi:hypothetical protein
MARAVQPTAAGARLRLAGEILVESEKPLVEAGVADQRVAQWGPP